MVLFKYISNIFLDRGCDSRGGQRPMGNSKSQKSDVCPIDSHFIGIGLLRTVFKIVVACREGPAPEFCYIAGDIGGEFPKIVFSRYFLTGGS